MVLPGLSSSSLVGVRPLVDDGCEVTFQKLDALITKNNKLLHTAYRNPRDGLWDLMLQQASSPKAHKPPPHSQHLNAVISLKQKKHELFDFLQATLFSPTKSTLLNK